MNQAYAIYEKYNELLSSVDETLCELIEEIATYPAQLEGFTFMELSALLDAMRMRFQTEFEREAADDSERPERHTYTDALWLVLYRLDAIQNKAGIDLGVSVYESSAEEWVQIRRDELSKRVLQRQQQRL
jgi:hypothetical protein